MVCTERLARLLRNHALHLVSQNTEEWCFRKHSQNAYFLVCELNFFFLSIVTSMKHISTITHIVWMVPIQKNFLWS